MLCSRETNLKVKQGLTLTGDMGDDTDVLAKFKGERSRLLTLSPTPPDVLALMEAPPTGEVQCEPPNNRLDKFRGNLITDGQTYGLDNEKILLRGCTLRNTEWCFGLVVFGGKRCPSKDDGRTDVRFDASPQVPTPN